MSEMTRQGAHDALADIVWWLKGFKAAQPEDGFQSMDASHMIDQALAVQKFVNSLDVAKAVTV